MSVLLLSVRLSSLCPVVWIRHSRSGGLGAYLSPLPVLAFPRCFVLETGRSVAGDTVTGHARAIQSETVESHRRSAAFIEVNGNDS